MIFQNLDLLKESPLDFLKLLAMLSVALLVAITVHEFSHALAAFYFGDDTAQRQGRLSLNPLKHLDPIGTLMLLFVGFGWGKPVPVNAYRLHVREMALVAFAGPLSNLIFGALIFLPFRFGNLIPLEPLVYMRSENLILPGPFGYILFFSIVLALFNLIPIPPLDGFNIAMGFIPARFNVQMSKLVLYGPIILVLIIAADMFLGLGILNRVLFPAVSFLGWIISGQRVF